MTQSRRSPVLIVDPFPRSLAEIFDPPGLEKLASLGEIITHEGGRMPPELIEKHLGEVELLIGQTDMDSDRLRRAPRLRAIINVETNFGQNIDYDYCFDHGIHILTPGSAFATVVAEAALAMGIDLARGITAADRDFRVGREHYGLDGNAGCFTFSRSPIGIIGYGDLGRELHRLLKPFDCPIRVFDPWLPDYFLRKQGLEPSSLEHLLVTSRVVFVLAGSSSENQGFIARREFELMQPGSVFLLLSRAAVVNFPDMLEQAQSGRIKIGTDVFPVEPVPSDDPLRSNPGILLSAHRCGAMRDALLDIGAQTLADAGLILRGLPPVVCRRAQRETVGRLRSPQVSKS